VAAGKSTIDRTVFTAQSCSEELHALLAENFLFAESCDSLRRSVPRSYSPISIKGHHSFGYAVENRLEELAVFHVSLRVLLGCDSHGEAGMVVGWRTAQGDRLTLNHCQFLATL
jgi:hypothetical protein